MMKLKFALLLFGGLVFAQTPKEQLLDNNWFLTEIFVDGEFHTPPSNEEMGTITMGVDPEEESEMYWFHTEVCSVIMGGLVTISDDTIYFFDFFGGFQCSSPENQDFELMYATFYGDSTNFNYSISNNSDSLILIISDSDGNSATYSNQLMSAEDTYVTNIKIYPNPVKDKLRIENPDLKITSIKVSDASGKMVVQQTVSGKQEEIDFSRLPTGIYFVSFEENGKVLKTEKVIKQ